MRRTLPGDRARILVSVGVLLALYAPIKAAQTLTVTIVNRQDNVTDYTYVVPGFSSSTSNTNVDCVGGTNAVNCSGSTNTTGFHTPAMQATFRVRGATFSLQLPDGRIAVVNCQSKFAERLAGPQGNRRSCRVPLVDTIQVDFDGDNAKLVWPVSIDGKKMQSETYKILGILNRP